MNPGDLLRAVRRERRLSQRELATYTGVPRSTIDRVESGRTASPRFDVVDTILDATGYGFVIADHLGRRLFLQPGHDDLFDGAARYFPAHLAARKVSREGDGWWGWRRIAWLPDDPRVPEYSFDLRGRALRDAPKGNWAYRNWLYQPGDGPDEPPSLDDWSDVT